MHVQCYNWQLHPTSHYHKLALQCTPAGQHMSYLTTDERTHTHTSWHLRWCAKCQVSHSLDLTDSRSSFLRKVVARFMFCFIVEVKQSIQAPSSCMHISPEPWFISTWHNILFRRYRFFQHCWLLITFKPKSVLALLLQKKKQQKMPFNRNKPHKLAALYNAEAIGLVNTSATLDRHMHHCFPKFLVAVH